MLAELLSRAWTTRNEHFDAAIECSYPTKTLAVTLTGRGCGLLCAHCNGRYLEGMVPLQDVRERAKQIGARSLLISGGCSPEGKVPFLPYLRELKELKDEYRLNFHVGLVNEEEAAAVGELAAAVSFDVTGDDETIREVYGLNATVADYERVYKMLRQQAPVLPHICVGLRGGKISGERKALEMIGRHGADALVFIVLIPTRGTAFAHLPPPDLREVATLLAEARIDFPGTPIYLGCMRPGGRYRASLDVLALMAGVNKIVNPAPRAIRVAKRLGLEVHRGEECCVL